MPRSRRREFTKRQRAAIVQRAMDPSGVLVCEGCGLILGSKPYEIDHILAEALVVDKSAPLSIEDGQLLGKECCHRGGKTQADLQKIRKADRQFKRHYGVTKPTGKLKGRGFVTAQKKRAVSAPLDPLPRRNILTGETIR